MNKKEIIQIFESKLNEKPIQIIDKSKGIDQIVKIIKTKNKIYIIKFPKYPNFKESFFREIKGLELFKRKIPVPKIIIKDKNYLIQEYLSGEDLDDLNLSKKDLQKIYYSLGKITRKMHLIKMRGFGPLNSKGKPKFKKLKNYLDKDINKSLLKLSKTKIFSKKQIGEIKKYFEDRKNYLDSRESYLLHLDLDAYNIIIENKRIKGIIDFGDLFAGPKMIDLVRIYISNYYNRFFNDFIKGYGKVDLEEIRYFSLWNLSWRIPHYKKIGKIKKLNHTIKVLKDIVGIN